MHRNVALERTVAQGDASIVGRGGVPMSMLLALMLTVFTVGAGYGLLLPLLPYLIERLLGAEATEAAISRHTGLLTSVYTLAIFLFAPFWGWASDRYGRRRILLTGLLGFRASMLTFSFVESLSGANAERFVSGLFAAAVSPVAAAATDDIAPTEEVRARRLTIVSLTGVSGVLLGPMLAVLMARLATLLSPVLPRAGSLVAPLIGAALLVFFAASVVATTIPTRRKLVARPGSLVMVAAQVIVFSPWIKPELTRWPVFPALTVFAAGLFLAPRAGKFTAMLAVIGAVAASAGILLPALTYWISRNAGRAQGWQLDQQTAAISLGTAAGSTRGGFLFGTASLPDAASLLMTGARENQSRDRRWQRRPRRAQPNG